MSNEGNEKTSHVLFVKEQVLRFAAKINHTHTTNDITDISEKYAPKKHDTSGKTYGIGSTDKYGHVKVDANVNTSSTNPVQSKGIASAISSAVTSLESKINNIISEKLYIVTEHLEEWEFNDDVEDVDGKIKKAIPTAKAVYNAMKNYKDLLIGIDLARPLSINKDIDIITDAGYYIQTGLRSFSYGGETIYYTNGLIKVEKQANRLIQYVHSTSKITSGGQTTYKINGCEYVRWGAIYPDRPIPVWNSWEVSHKPYTKTIRACNFGTGVDGDGVRVFENTGGFIIHWDQIYQPDDRYPVTAELYEYTTVCEFNPPLPITGPYVYGNLIGRFDIKIEAEKMQIRSNVSKGGRIIHMHETWFVPRNQ